MSEGRLHQRGLNLSSAKLSSEPDLSSDLGSAHSVAPFYFERSQVPQADAQPPDRP